MTAHVVVRVEPCTERVPYCDLDKSDRCLGCLGDGTRAVLDDAVPVEQFGRTFIHWEVPR